MTAKKTIQWVGALLSVLLWSFAHAGTVTYVYTDPQGTPLAKADARGTIIATYDYAPYGQAVVSMMSGAPDGPGYTGHVNDPETGLVYMQARYYDPQVGRFLSVDPVGVNSGDSFGFNRYDYAANNPIKNIDPDGRLARGTGWNAKQWNQFNLAQRRAAGGLENASVKITNALASGGKDLQRAKKSFESNFGAGTATPENMTKAAADMSAMAAALRDTSSTAISANAMTGEALTNAYPKISSNTLAGVPTNGPMQVLVNVTHPGFNNAFGLAWAAGHETAHAVLGYSDQAVNGISAYKFGSPQQKEIFGILPGPQRLVNPDHLMDDAL